MAYVPRTWSCGDKITANALNNIEDGIQEALECCENKDYECTETRTTLFEETVTTTTQGQVATAALNYATFISVDTLIVTCNGTEYQCDKVYFSDSENGYGAAESATVADWTKCPFIITSSSSPSAHNLLVTQTPGTFTVKAEIVDTEVTTTECFEAAVKAAYDDFNLPTTSISASPIAYHPQMRTLQLTGSYTINANSNDTLSFTNSFHDSDENTSMRAIDLPQGLAICGFVIYATGVDVKVRNVTSSAITATSSDASVEVVNLYTYTDTVCVLTCGDGGGDDPK